MNELLHLAYLAGDILVGNSNDHAVLWRIVFVLVLNNQPFPGVVVCFTLTTPLELDLESFEVSLVLNYLDETL